MSGRTRPSKFPGCSPRLGARAALAGYDEAVVIQAADLYQTAGGSLTDVAFRKSLTAASPTVRDGFRAYFEAWRESQTARATPAV
ncbi:MAG: hypothetical protein WBC44_16510 [Planctomycetaceae bacterium]